MSNIGGESTERPRPESRAGARLDALPRQELALEVEARLPPAPPATAVAAERTVAGDDAMARDHEPDRAAPDSPTDRARRAGLADHPRHLAVARRRSRGNAPDGSQHETVPRRPVLQVDGQGIEGGQVAVE